MRHGMTAEGFFLQTVPSLAADGLRKMGFDDSEIALIDVNPLHMLLCERGGFSPLSRNCEREEGTLLFPSILFGEIHSVLFSHRNVWYNDRSNSCKKRL